MNGYKNILHIKFVNFRKLYEKNKDISLENRFRYRIKTFII